MSKQPTLQRKFHLDIFYNLFVIDCFGIGLPHNHSTMFGQVGFGIGPLHTIGIVAERYCFDNIQPGIVYMVLWDQY